MAHRPYGSWIEPLAAIEACKETYSSILEAHRALRAGSDMGNQPVQLSASISAFLL